jgi:8-oxo-dGTP diphosphatase
MDEFILSSEERKQIFKILCENKRLAFNEIARMTGIRSNKLSYQLNLMAERGFVINDNGYSLSIEAQRLIPYFSQIFKKEVGVLPVVLGIVRHQDKILLIQRRKMPYKGYWGLIGAKQISGETIPETIERECMEEASLKTQFKRYNALVYERLREEGRFKNSFLFIITTVHAQTDIIQEREEGKVAWFDYEEVINGKVPDLIPSDVEFLKAYAAKQISIDHVVIEEDQEKLTLAQP